MSPTPSHGTTPSCTWQRVQQAASHSEGEISDAFVTGFGAEREARGRPVMETRHDPLRDAASPERPSLG